MFDVRTRRPIPGNFRAERWINDVAFSPDGTLLAVVTGGGEIQLWDLRTATLRHRLRAAVDQVAGVEFSSHGQTLVTLSVDEADTPNNFLTRWDVASGSRLTGPVRVSSYGGDALVKTPDGVRLVTLGGAEVVVTDAETLHPIRRFPRTPRTGLAALHPHGRTLALGLEGGALELMDLSTGRRRLLGRDQGAVATLAFSPDGAKLATGGIDGRVLVWDVAAGQVQQAFEGHEGRIGAPGLRFSWDGRTLYSAGPTSVIAWDLEGSGRLGRPFRYAPLPPQTAPVRQRSRSVPMVPSWPPPTASGRTISPCATCARSNRPGPRWPQGSVGSRR